MTDLFPTPHSPVSVLSPAVWGPSPSSTAALQSTLRDNHERWDIFFNDAGFHNHAAHHVLAIWALGASASVIDAAYAYDCKQLRPSQESPNVVNRVNFQEHLGNRRYYSGYRKFFTDEFTNGKDLSTLVEEYIFAQDENHVAGVRASPDMLSRFLDSILHPIIHVGYGLEFGIPGLVIEGLAMTAIHETTSSNVIPSSQSQTSNPSIIARLASFRISAAVSPNTHAFTIVARILKHSQFEHATNFEALAETHGKALLQYTEEWFSADVHDPAEVTRKMEELIWLNAIIYGVTGWREGKDFHADFVKMHLVTSSLFLSSTIVHLKITHQVLLLRAYLNVCLLWWIARGRPGFDFAGFYGDDTSYPRPSGPLPTPSKSALLKSPDALTPNPWLPIIETTVIHADEHVPKLQRSLAHYAALYGASPADRFNNTELPGAELLDGSLFIRVAGLTAKRMGRVREGEDALPFWDRDIPN